jgi:ParB/RepB/Spo0J family partition protein
MQRIAPTMTVKGDRTMENLWVPELVALGEIDCNPWQVRADDPAHVMDVAHSISEHVLLQPGLGRRCADGRVQLALGHTRLAAYRYLDEQFGVKGNGQAGDWYTAFPVIVRELSDEQMAAYAIEENFKRKDLSGIEKARALQRYCADFGKTQAEAGERFSLGQSAVSHLLRLLELPAPVQELVNAGALPERFARQLVSLARVAPEDVVQAAQVIAEAEPEEREDAADQQLDALLDAHGRELKMRGGCYWDADWRPSDAAVACKVCPSRVTMRGQESCTDLACFEARQEAWQSCELERIADKFNIPMAQVGEGKPLKLDYNNLDLVRGMLKRKVKPDCLRVMAIQVGGYWSYHADVLGSKMVLLGSTDTLILDREQRAKEAKAAGQDALAVDDPKAQAEAEDAERDERREQRAAVRRAQYDIPWLIFNVAESCAGQVAATGKTLDWLVEMAREQYLTPTGWSQFDDLFDPLDNKFGVLDLGKASEAEKRIEALVVCLSSEVDTRYDPSERYDWPRALEEVEKKAGELGLRLPKGWDTPPVNQTPTNCRVCGRFTSMDHVTQRDMDEGWVVDGERVTCSDECRAQVAKPAMAKKAKSPAAIAKKPVKKAKRK